MQKCRGSLLHAGVLLDAGTVRIRHITRFEGLPKLGFLEGPHMKTLVAECGLYWSPLSRETPIENLRFRGDSVTVSQPVGMVPPKADKIWGIWESF